MQTGFLAYGGVRRLVQGGEVTGEHAAGAAAVLDQQNLAELIGGGIHDLLGVVGGHGGVRRTVDDQAGGLDVDSDLQHAGVGRLEPVGTGSRDSRQSKAMMQLTAASVSARASSKAVPANRESPFSSRAPARVSTASKGLEIIGSYGDCGLASARGVQGDGIADETEKAPDSQKESGAFG